MEDEQNGDGTVQNGHSHQKLHHTAKCRLCSQTAAVRTSSSQTSRRPTECNHSSSSAAATGWNLEHEGGNIKYYTYYAVCSISGDLKRCGLLIIRIVYAAVREIEVVVSVNSVMFISSKRMQLVVNYS